MFYPPKVFTADQEALIVEAIRAFERRTSGEMRVHIESRLRRPPLDEALRVFFALGMQHTAQRNGVLLLLAPGQRTFAIYGDEGIDAVTDEYFWDAAASSMKPHFAIGHYVEGLLAGISIAGEALAAHFPWREGDINELPDTISYA